MSNKQKKDIKVTVHVDVMLTGHASSKDAITQFFKDRYHPIFLDVWSGVGEGYVSLKTGENKQEIISIKEVKDVK